VPDAISNTSPLFYLHRVGALDWLGNLFGDVWVPSAVLGELQAGGQGG
jgi:predicted nucleic acid-binding protein